MATQPIPVSPRDEAEKEQAKKIYKMLILQGTAALIGPDNSRIDLPPSIHKILVGIVQQMQEGKAIALLPMTEKLSTQAAANILGVSRQFVVRELENRKIPFHRVGSHRRLILKDLLEYMNARQKQRRDSIERMAHAAEESGIYDTFVPPDE